MKPPGPVKRPGPLVEVEWMDIFTSEGWQSVHEQAALLTGEAGVRCVTLGYLLAETSDRVVVCSATSSDGEVDQISVIPRGVVRRINRLGPVRRARRTQ